MIVSIPIVSMPGNKHIKHALEWDFFLGVILFYVLTFFMWKNKANYRVIQPPPKTLSPYLSFL